jgi:membrane protease YdiL (CAAX protease family)
LLISAILLTLSKVNIEENHDLVFLLIIPIARISTLFISSHFYQPIAFYLIVFFLTSFYLFNLNINPGFTKKNILFFPVIIILFSLIGFLGNQIFTYRNLNILFLIPLIAYSEEILFRGLLQKYITKEQGALFSIAIVSLLFMAFSFGFGLVPALFLFIVSILLGLIYNYTNNIYLTIIGNAIVTTFILIIPHLG